MFKNPFTKLFASTKFYTPLHRLAAWVEKLDMRQDWLAHKKNANPWGVAVVFECYNKDVAFVSK